MESTNFIATIGVVFALVAVGYVIAWTGILKAGTGEILGEFVFTIAIPLLLFRTLAEVDFEGANPFPLWLTYFPAVAIAWAAAMIAVRRGFGRDARSGVVAGLAASFANLVLLGIPLILALFGERGFAILSLLLSIHLPIMMATSVILFGPAERRDGVSAPSAGMMDALAKFLRGMAMNPIVIGILGGLAWRATGWTMPVIPAEVIARIGQLGGTLALVALGMSLFRFGIARNVPQALATSAVKTLLMPAVVTVIALLLDLPPLMAQVAILCAAMPTGVNPYLIAGRFGTGEALASNTMVLSTAAAPFTLVFWLWVSQSLFP